MTRHHGCQLCARPVGSVDQPPGDRMLIRQGNRAVAEQPEDVAGGLKLMRDQAAGDCGTDGVKLKFEGCSHTEIAAPAANCPEQIRRFSGACKYLLARSRHQFDRTEVVESEAMFAHQPAQPAAERESGNPGAGHDAAGHGQAMGLRLAIEFCPGDATLHPSDPPLGIDENALHGCDIDHQATVDGRSPGNVMAATANRRFEAQPLREVDGTGHVRRTATSRYQRRAFVDQPVVDPSRLVVVGVRGLQELAGERFGKFRRRLGNR